MNSSSAGQQGLVWCGPVFDPSGYADEGRGMLCALEHAGVPVTLRPLHRLAPGFREGLPAAERTTLDRQVARSLPARQILVQHHTADAFFQMEGDVYHVGRTMFETDSIPAAWVRHCNQMDELWLPSQFNIDTFRRAGVHVPIVRVPGGIDSSVFHPGVTPMSVSGLRGTVFLAVFEWRLRKGWDVLLRAWADAFSPDDDVTLVLRTYPIDKVSAQDNETIINARIDAFLASECGRSRRDVAPIVVLGRTVPGSAMPSLYRIATALVAPTRGEGWGRPFMEAMASGVPVIATRWSAHLEFMNDDNSLLLDIDGTEVADGVEMPLYREQRWAAPSTPHLCALMQRVYAQPDETRALGVRARDDMISLWPWSRAAKVMSQRLSEIRDLSAAERTPLGQTPSGQTPSGPRLLLDARLFDPTLGESTLDRIAGHLIARWPHRALVHTRVTSPRRPSRSSPLMHAYRAFVAADNKSVARRNVADTALHTQPDDLVLTWLDSMSVRHVCRPRCARWTVHTGDLVVNTVPHTLVRVLRDEADEVWVPTAAARDACIQVGVHRDRLWLMPAVSAPGHVTPHGPRLPLRQRADVIFLLPAIDVAQAPAVDTILRTWQRAFDARQSALLLLYAPESPEPAIIAWHHQLIAMLSSGRLLLGAPIQVLRDRLPTDELAALVRAADVLLDPAPTPRTMPMVHMALAVERTVISSGGAWRDVLRAAAHRDERARCVASSRSHAQLLASDASVAAAASQRLLACASGGVLPRHMSLVSHGAAPFAVHDLRATTILAHLDWHDGTGGGVVQSYLRAFSTSDDVSLVLCLDPAQGLTVEHVGSLVREAARAAGHDETTMAEVVLIPDVLTDEVRRALVARCDAVVCVHDAILAEAARLSGRRVITTLSPGAWRASVAAPLATA